MKTKNDNVKRIPIVTMLILALCVTICFVIFPLTARATENEGSVSIDATNFPDANFRTWISKNIESAADGILTAEELAAVTVMDVSGQNIADLTGIAYFTGLTTLTCSNNALTSLDVSALTALEKLYCQNNRLTSLDLSSNTNLSECPSNGQTRFITIDESQKTYTMPTDFDSTKASIIAGGSFSSDGVLTVDANTCEVTYTYGASKDFFSLGTTLVVSNAANHGTVTTDGTCETCGRQFGISLENEETSKTNYFDSFADVAESLDNTNMYLGVKRITLYKDITVEDKLLTMYSHECNLDLNGKTLEFTAIGGDCLTLVGMMYIDDTSDGKTGKIYYDRAGNEAYAVLAATGDFHGFLVEGGTIDVSQVNAAFEVTDSATVNQTGGVIKNSILLNEGFYILNGGMLETSGVAFKYYGFDNTDEFLSWDINDPNANYDIKITGGTITAGSLIEYLEGSVRNPVIKLTGGTFTNGFTVNDYNTGGKVPIANFLPRGYTFCNENGKIALEAEQTALTVTVSVAACADHSGGTATCTALAVCEYCQTSYGEYDHPDTDADGVCDTCGNLIVSATNFPDENFRTWITANITGAADGVLTADELAAVSTLYVQNLNISDLTGIEHFTALETLCCYENQLKSLDVSNNPSVLNLYCQNNHLTSLDLTTNTLISLFDGSGQTASITIDDTALSANLPAGVTAANVAVVSGATLKDEAFEAVLGDTVVYTYATGLTDMELTVTLTVTNPHTHTDADGDYTCDACGTYLGNFKSIAVSLGKDITVKYYTAGDLENPVIRFTINGYTKTVSGTLTEDGAQYEFVFDGVAPQWIGDTIKAEILVNGAVLETKEYSVLTYLKALKDKSADDLGYSAEKYNAMLTLINDLLVYGGAAQTYTKHNTDNLVSEGITGTTFTDLEKTDKSVEQGSVVTFAGATVFFDSTNHLRFYCKASDLTGVVFKIKVNDGEEVIVTPTAVGEQYLIKTADISATGFDDVYTLTAYVNGEKDATLTYSVKSYVHSKQSGENANAALARATYNYGLAAKAFVEQ